MALLPCPNCGHSVSDRALACPRCGTPHPVASVRPAPPEAKSTARIDPQASDGSRREHARRAVVSSDPSAHSDRPPETWGEVKIDLPAISRACGKGLRIRWARLRPRLVSLWDGIVDRVKQARPAHRWAAAAALGVALAFLAGYLVSGAVSGDNQAVDPVSGDAGPPDRTAPQSPPRSEITTRIPVLMVAESNGKKEGRVVDVTLTLTRESESAAPFQVAFLEDTPGGHGAQLRSSVWMAAMVAALLRDTDLAGCRLTAAIPGPVDGPSAGGVLCLGILGLMDGQPFPADLAVTGTVLPDGALGQVGGLALKIDAAGQRGMRRIVVPAHLRFDVAAGSEDLVDLKAAAERFPMAFLPVAEIGEAYEVAFRASPDRRPRPRAASVRPDDRLDALLAAQAVASLRQGETLWKELESDRDALQRNEHYRNAMARQFQQAVEALDAGFVLTGHSEVRAFGATLEARKRWQAFVRGLSSAAEEDQIRRLDEETIAALQPFQDPATLAESWIALTNGSPIATQYFVELADLCATPATVASAGSALTNRAEQAASAPGATGEPRADDDSATIRDRKAIQLLVALTGQALRASTERDLQEIGRLLPERGLPTGRADRVERLWHAVLTTLEQTLSSNVVEPLAERSELSSSETLERLRQQDPLLATYLETAGACQRLHDRLERLRSRGKSNESLAAATAQLSATQVAVAAGVLVRWTELDVASGPDGTMRIGRKAALSRMVWTARDNAHRNIEECLAQDVPCPRAIEFLQAAELARDDGDPVEALVAYWQAALQAQTLRLLFTADGSPTPER